jgi:hypothetical protein
MCLQPNIMTINVELQLELQNLFLTALEWFKRSQRAFLLNERNKETFSESLIACLQHTGFTAQQAKMMRKDDADILIATTALELAKQKRE